MHRGAKQDRWERHALLYTLLANANRDPKRRGSPYQPGDFNRWPEEELSTADRPKVSVSMKAMMASVFDRDTTALQKELTDAHSE